MGQLTACLNTMGGGACAMDRRYCDDTATGKLTLDLIRVTCSESKDEERNACRSPSYPASLGYGG